LKEVTPNTLLIEVLSFTGKVNVLYTSELTMDAMILWRTHYFFRVGRQDGTVGCHMRDQLPLMQAMRLRTTTRMMNKKQVIV